nr:SDR family NAD(P)-dependent oxidoreductase [Enterovibrio nigricans]
MDIAKSVIVITAAGTPTGRAMAEYFCRLNARVALVDTDSPTLQTTYENCLKVGGICYSFCLPSRSVENISHLFTEVNREMGAVDVLINYWQAGAAFLACSQAIPLSIKPLRIKPLLMLHQTSTCLDEVLPLICLIVAVKGDR